MVSGRYKSRTFRRVFRKTPGGRTVIHYRLRKPDKAICAICKKPLHGVPRDRPSIVRNMPKSQRTVSRPYGGNLCSRCMRQKIKNNIKIS